MCETQPSYCIWLSVYFLYRIVFHWAHIPYYIHSRQREKQNIARERTQAPGADVSITGVSLIADSSCVLMCTFLVSVCLGVEVLRHRVCIERAFKEIDKHQISFTIVHSHSQFMKVLITPNTCQYLSFSLLVFF